MCVYKVECVWTMDSSKWEHFKKREICIIYYSQHTRQREQIIMREKLLFLKLSELWNMCEMTAVLINASRQWHIYKWRKLIGPKFEICSETNWLTINFVIVKFYRNRKQYVARPLNVIKLIYIWQLSIISNTYPKIYLPIKWIEIGV